MRRERHHRYAHVKREQSKTQKQTRTHQVANQWAAAVPVAVQQNFRMLKLRAKTIISPDFTGVKSLFVAYS